MENVWQKIDELRESHKILGDQKTPIDVFSFFELDLPWRVRNAPLRPCHWNYQRNEHRTRQNLRSILKTAQEYEPKANHVHQYSEKLLTASQLVNNAG